MIIKNTGAKIISIGTTVLMPDAEMKVSKGIAETPAIKAFVRMGFVKIEDDAEEKAAKKKLTEEAATKKAAEKAAKKAAEEEAAKKKAAEEAAAQKAAKSAEPSK